MLVEVSTVRSCKMAIRAVSVVLTLWGMHSNALFYCDPICLGNVTSGIFWSLLRDSREERLVSVDCSLSANCILCLPCALFFNIVLAHERRRVAGLYVVSRLRAVLVQLIRTASPKDKERLFTMVDCCSCKKPVHTSIPLTPATET